MLDLTTRLGPPRDEATVSTMAAGLVGSEILKIAADIRAMEARGEKLCNLTVGDFKPREFPIPEALGEGIAKALRAGETNYPPSDGVLELRQVVQRFYERALGLKYPIEGVVIAGGARPIIYGTYRAVLNKGDTVVFPVPSWNNNHYVHLMEARGVPVRTTPENGFLPTAASLEKHLPGARLLVICSPSNPTGTMMPPDRLEAIARLIVDENKGRQARGEKPLILLYDQIYWQLALGDVKHVTPVQLVPEIAPYTVFVDGVSKAFAATGIRVGWGVGPPSIIARMRDMLGHVGAWAPKAEQIATAKWLDDAAASDSFVQQMRQRTLDRMRVLYEGLSAMGARGLPVRAIPPQGAIYLTVQFDLIGRAGVTTNEEIRKLLLEKAGFAVVPFRAFDLPDDSGWFRLSVGAVSVKEIEDALPRVEAAIRGRLS
jgi:aspartate aminotransferase